MPIPHPTLTILARHTAHHWWHDAPNPSVLHVETASSTFFCPFAIITLLTLNIALFWSFSFATAAERRVALVIGNGKYEESPLRNPVNDATDLGNTLKRLGFSVTVLSNANKQRIEEAALAFSSALKGGGEDYSISLVMESKWTMRTSSSQ